MSYKYDHLHEAWEEAERAIDAAQRMELTQAGINWILEEFIKLYAAVGVHLGTDN